jgi:ubiquinone/menaquinone biosynthesis C-methylase UbiE
MSFYQDQILPRLIHLAMRQKRLLPYRSRVMSGASGRVLEIGIGSGLNLPFYSPEVTQIIGLEPSPKLLELSRDNAADASMSLELIGGTAESIPIENHSLDTIVTTWTLCSIPDVKAAIAEMRRVLKPSGQLLFVEHGRAPESRVRWWQDHLTPAWKSFSGGCHLNRAIDELIEGGGFQFQRLEKAYMRGPKPMTFMYEGSAKPK